MKLPITNPNEALRKLIKRQQTTTTSNNSDDSQKSSSSFLHLYEPPSNSTTTTTNSTTTTTTTTTSITPTPIFNNENHENNDSNNNSEINDDDSDSTINTTNTNTNTTNTTTIGSWTDTATVHHSPTPTPPTHTLTSSTSSLKSSSSPIPFLDLLYKRRYTIHTSPNHINHNINNNSDANNSLNDDNNRTNSSAESVVEYHSELSPEPWWTINGLQPIMIRSLTSPTTPLSPSHHVSHHGNHQYYEKKLEKNDQEHENGENEQNLKEKNEKAMIAIYEDYFSHVKHDHDIENDEKHERKHEKHEKNDEKQFHLFRMLKNESLLHEIMNDSDAMCRVRRSRSKMSQLVRLVHSKPWIYSLSSNFEPKNENFGENNAKNRYQGVKKQEFTCVVWQSFSELYRLVDQLPPNCYQLFLKKKLKVHFHDDDNSGGGENGENHHSNVHGETQTVETGENRGSENVVNSKTEDDNENKENEGKNDRENIGNDTCTDNRTCHDGNDDDTTGENNVENRDEKACIVDDKMDDNNVQNVQNVQNAKSVENNVSSYSNSQNSSGNSTNGGGGGERRDGIEGIEENGETIFAHDSVNQILADVPRSKLGTGNIDEYESRMTESEMLIERTKLFNVLYSVCMFYPTIGYCQGMSYICTMLLRTMDHSEELTFFMMINLIENYEMRGLFVPSFPLLRKISFVFEQLMTKRHSKLWSHLNSVGISSELFIPKWLLPMFCLDFPQDFVLRVWDCFLLEGWKAIYQVLCAILVQNEAVLMRCTDPAVIIFRLQELPLSLTRVEQQCQLFESCSKMFSDRDYKKAVNEFEKLQQQEQQQRQQQVQRRSFSFRARSRSFFL